MPTRPASKFSQSQCRHGRFDSSDMRPNKQANRRPAAGAKPRMRDVRVERRVRRHLHKEAHLEQTDYARSEEGQTERGRNRRKQPKGLERHQLCVVRSGRIEQNTHVTSL